MTDRSRIPVPDPVPDEVFARRIARIAFGAVLLAGVLTLVAAAAADAFHTGSPPRLSAAQILDDTWLAATLVGVAAYALAAALRLSLAPDALFVPSLVVPVAGAALILPFTLHRLLGLAIGSSSSAFDDWVQVSLVITGAAHVVFAALCVARVRRLATGGPALTPPRIFCITVAVSCVPFVLLYGIPPLVVALTGLPILPLLYGMKPVVDREREEIGALQARLPRAKILRRAG